MAQTSTMFGGISVGEQCTAPRVERRRQRGVGVSRSLVGAASALVDVADSGVRTVLGTSVFRARKSL